MDILTSKEQLNGLEIYFPGSPDYERSVATPNLLYRYMTPLFVVKASTFSHVQATVQLAKKLGVSITVKNGGHSFAGFSNSDDGILLDISEMRKVEIKIEKTETDEGTLTLEGGALWNDAYKLLINRRVDRDQYIVIGGRCSAVGVSGFTLGGGLSPFTRSYGMAIDQLKEVTIVTAEGDLVTLKDSELEDECKKKLFWALRGSGGGNFGILVRMKVKVHKLKDSSGTVVSGKFMLQPADSNIQHLQDFIELVKPLYLANWPNEITLDTVWTCDLAGGPTPFATTCNVCYNGNKKDFDTAIEKCLKRHPKLAREMKDKSLAEKSTLFLHETLPDQWSEEQGRFCPVSKSYNIHSSFVYENDKTTIDGVTWAITDLMIEFRKKFSGSKSLLEFKMIHGGGKASEVGSHETAFPWRKGVYFGHIAIQWVDKWLETDMRGFYTTCRKKLVPYSMDGKAAFINFTDRDLRNWQHAYYGSNYKELQEVKLHWDPSNFFNFEQSIKGARQQVEQQEEPDLEEQAEGEYEPLAQVMKSWERFVLPQATFEELARIVGHSCPKC
ncbi:hypothetical protein BDZ91DRAFT_697832 [Kalaharituber pfeilii]|nr:hypothetical protein BDZ91DRAFT_697832 [Kalaharituber pfeilii]